MSLKAIDIIDDLRYGVYMKYDVIIYDIYNVYYKAINSSSDVFAKYKKDKIQTNGISNTLQRLNDISERYGNENVMHYYLFDNAKSKPRKNRELLLPNYKIGRKVENRYFYRGLDYLEIILGYYNDNYCIRVPGFEADDFVGNVIDHDVMAKNDDLKVLLISEDGDWSAFISENVHQLKKNIIWDKSKFFEYYGFEATRKNIYFYKTFYGDKSDNIEPTLGNFERDRFHKCIDTFDNIYQFTSSALKKELDWLDEGYLRKIESIKDLIHNTWEVVSHQDLSKLELDSYKKKCKFDRARLGVVYEMLGLKIFDKRYSKEIEKTVESFFDGDSESFGGM